MSIAPSSNSTMLARLAPALFVLLWSTGFIGAKYGLPYAEPLTFLLVRLALVAGLLLVIALVMRAPWPKRIADIGHIAIAGLLVHGIYLGGIFTAIHHGLPAGVSALIAGLQPVLVALAAGPLLGERVRPLQWLGFGLGLLGVVLVVSEKLALDSGQWTGVGLATFALFGITLGTLYQKRFCSDMDLRTGTIIQYVATCLAYLAIIPFTETMHIAWTPEFIFALAWLCLVLSVGAIFLLFRLIRLGAASKVSSLFYLVPPSTALIAFLMFDETLGAMALLGMAMTVLGVALVNRQK